jgi:hypothetical protein
MFGQEWHYAGFWYLFSLVLALWAVFNIAQSRSGPLGKAIWIVVVLFLPFLGFVGWLVIGPKRSR